MTVMAIRETPKTTAPCPSWCTIDHRNPVEGADHHMSDIASVDLSSPEYGQRYQTSTLANIQQTPDVPEAYITLTNHEGCAEDWLTQGEAEGLASRLRKLAAASRTPASVWCTDEHCPGEAHFGEIEVVPLGFYPLGIGKFEDISLVVMQDEGEAPYIALVNHNGKDEDRLTADEAEQLADVLQALAATIRKEAGACV